MYVCFAVMTFSKNYKSIFVKTTWLVYREEYLSEFKWNCYLTSKKFALTEMAMELGHFDMMGLTIMTLMGRLPESVQKRACLLA